MSDLSEAERNARRDRRMERFNRAFLFTLGAIGFVMIGHMTLDLFRVASSTMLILFVDGWSSAAVAFASTLFGYALMWVVMLSLFFSTSKLRSIGIGCSYAAAALCSIGFVASLAALAQGESDPLYSYGLLLAYAFLSPLLAWASIALVALHDKLRRDDIPA